MADFNVQAPGVPNQASLPPPVVDTSTADALQSFGSIAGTVFSGIAGAAAKGAKEQKQQASDRILSGFEQNLLLTADLHDQGVYNQDTARRKARVQLAKTLANNPGLRDDINQIFGKVMETAGLGKNIDTGTEEEQQIRQVAKDGIKSGLLPADVDPLSDKGKNLISAYQQYRAHASQLEQTKAELDLKRAQIGYQTDVVQLAGAKQSLATGAISQQTARLNLVEKQAEVQSRAAITGGAKAFNTLFGNQLADIQSKVANGQMTKEDAILQIDKAYSGVQQVVNQTGAYAGGDYVGTVLSPMTRMAQAMKDHISGKIDADVAQNTMQAESLKSQMMVIHSDPKLARAITLSKLLPLVPSEIQSTISSNVVDNMRKWLDGDPSKNPPNLNSTEDNNKDVKQTLSVLKVGLGNYAAGNIKDQDQLKELTNGVTQAVNSFGKYGSASDTPKELMPLIQLFASPEFGKFARDGKLNLDQPTQDKLKKVLEDNYFSGVIPAVAKEYFSKDIQPNPLSKIGGPAAEQAQHELQVRADKSQYVDMKYQGGKVVFIPKDPNDYSSRESAKSLNGNVAPILTTSLNAYVNVTGDDPSLAFDQISSKVMEFNPNKN